ncbi:hypothetical protein MHK_010084 [Candidatus Magnetomorum sp. HK-1]|nr:hypothetical protein MHK_010084 [Candidatus Magnetomorum sp. HK-1]
MFVVKGLVCAFVVCNWQNNAQIEINKNVLKENRKSFVLLYLLH